jgi:protein O-GlcNAc transferase
VLDTTPYGAHTTASDALWVGLPLITVAGPTFASRVAASLLQAQGAGELVAADLDDYARRVRDLAADRPRLRALRGHLERARAESGLFDGARFARDLEALYQRMAQRHAAGLPPDHLWAD